MISSASEFALQTWGSVDLGDQRLNRRAVAIGTGMAENPEASLPAQMKDPAALEGAYRFMNNKHVHLSALLEPTYQHTRQRAGEHAVVLWVNDQTEVDYTFHPAKTGLGPIGDGRGKGFLMHTTLAIVPELRQVLGVGYVQVYLRRPAPKPRPKWAHSPEGLAWETAAHQIGPVPPRSLWVHVSDAGSDIFAYLAACVDHNKHFLVRLSQNRRLDWAADDPHQDQSDAQKLLDYARQLSPVPGSQTWVEVPASPDQAARQAGVVMAWAPVTFSPSTRAPEAERQHGPLTAWVLRVWECDPPTGVEALEWVLLSSLPVTDLETARCRVDWYTCRWFCEDFHQCLKTGCRVEHSQLSDQADLEKLIGFAVPIAARLLQLRQAARQTPEQLASEVIDPLMVSILATRQKIEGGTMTTRTFWHSVARLGGFQGRKRDGDPGWRTIWRGWRYLSDLTEGARLFSDPGTFV